MEMIKTLTLIARVMKYVNFIKAARWRRPSESPEDQQCAVMEFDIELDAGKVAFMGVVTTVLRRFDENVDTDHPIFRYMGERQVQGLASNVTLTLSIKRTPE